MKPMTIPTIDPSIIAFASFLNWAGLRIFAANDLQGPGIRVLRSGWFTLRIIQMEMSRIRMAYPTSPSMNPKKIGNATAKMQAGVDLVRLGDGVEPDEGLEELQPLGVLEERRGVSSSAEAISKTRVDGELWLSVCLTPSTRFLGTHPSTANALSVKPKLFRTSSFLASMESCSSTCEMVP